MGRISLGPSSPLPRPPLSPGALSLSLSLAPSPPARFPPSLLARARAAPSASLSAPLCSARAPRARARESPAPSAPSSRASSPLAKPAPRAVARARARVVSRPSRVVCAVRVAGPAAQPRRPLLPARACRVADRLVAAAVTLCRASPRLSPVSSRRSKPPRRHRRRHRLGPATPALASKGRRQSLPLPSAATPPLPPPFPKEERGEPPFSPSFSPFPPTGVILPPPCRRLDASAERQLAPCPPKSVPNRHCRL
jgi:hypothetical protein